MSYFLLPELLPHPRTGKEQDLLLLGRMNDTVCKADIPRLYAAATNVYAMDETWSFNPCVRAL